MFAKSADPATMEEVQVLLEDSVKGLSFDLLVQRKLTQPLMCQSQDLEVTGSAQLIRISMRI